MKPLLLKLIEASADAEEHVAAPARQRVLGYVNRVYTTPSQEQRQAIACALEVHAKDLPGTFVQECRSWLADR